MILFIENDGKNSELKKLLVQCTNVCDEISNENGIRLREDFIPTFKRSDVDFYVMATELETGEVVGSMAMNEENSVMSIESTIVKPSMQGRGISRQMFRYLEEHLAGFEGVCSHIAKSNKESIHSRIAMGFKNVDGSASSEFFKPADKTQTTKRWQDAQPKTVKMTPRTEKSISEIDIHDQ